jgi:hypothetical protein
MKRSWMVATLLLTVLAVREAPSGLLPGLPTTPWNADSQPAGVSRDRGPVAAGPTSDTDTRAAHLEALARARRVGSLDGVLSAAEGLAALGDREGVERAIRIAEALTARDPEARADVRAFAQRIAPELIPSVE